MPVRSSVGPYGKFLIGSVVRRGQGETDATTGKLGRLI